MIEFKNVDVVFGKQPERALPLMDNGESLQEIQEKTGLTAAVRNASLKVGKGEICVLMGLSGSGKSSLLRTANGLNPVTRGDVFLETDQGIQNFHELSEDQRRHVRMNRISMVFQKFALMPWLTVAENVAFGLEQKGLDKSTVRTKAIEQLTLVGLGEWADKKPSELSGGMQQRVGLARAFAMETDIILMDEPFSALDPLIRSDLQDELLRLQKQLNKTVLFVSHDLDEALKLGNHIAIMKDGAIVQHDTPENIVMNPADDYVEAFVAHTNPIDVVNAQALMRRFDDFREKQGEICLSERDDCWLYQGDSINNSAIRYGDTKVPLEVWRDGDTDDVNKKRALVVPLETRMHTVMALRYQSGHGVLVEQDGKLVGHVGDREIYHAMLGKLIGDK
ncbi:glycine betaine/L-proline ABC transporter, ATPase subunit [Psychromonas ingrahamii 37]|uniref:Glycine betaine/L-proline ABC transporter, ATPase subunit n=1 Tax=Psychromonas ingrahamii (strain DSM 17664 / CCUG 51855 / 37) TaxID=357804 RepID=A1SWG1_PSYIN|nr:choline ABC transporter ATP-binding protein [Psychromonas ingrahamii]ABM03826.1 glycine betaine/L-proline ABC transporter, ATPase subunit [Psychromonas ingrahamii 37]